MKDKRLIYFGDYTVNDEARKCPRCIGGKLLWSIFGEVYCINCGYRIEVEGWYQKFILGRKRKSN